MKNLKIIVVVCLYDRFENLRRWIHAWDMCDKHDATLIIVNNRYEGIDTDFWEEYCYVRGVKYTQRDNVGYETGVIQSVLLGRILDEEDWDVFLFVTDDTIPIKKDFLTKYLDELLKPGVGIACMEISGVYTPHIRTTGWCITKEMAKRIVFRHDPIAEKEQCYAFEHTDGEYTLMAQVLKMGKRVVQVSDIESSALWDTHHTHLNRWEEWHKEFPGYN